MPREKLLFVRQRELSGKKEETMWCWKKKAETKPRRITADEYKKAFEPSNDEQNTQVKNDGAAPYSKLEKALEFAIRTREFEIGLFWKRSNMFMLLAHRCGICRLIYRNESLRHSQCTFDRAG